ncbi:hypothetical protein ILUMI_02238 [Ignelater luminosus]|uniref:CRAL-TRIO domain-containing protein n=1 Tax=Ignelater luminosus TaxID=2038154 RepID=A0A8K0DIM3_IGNLU|nr:hypothetical protein ILUMI_02238 [Ignelater luminosus]
MCEPAVKYEMDLSEPDQQLLDYAKENINEDPDTKLEVLEQLRDMIFERGECSPHRLDDDFLLRFLRARNFVVRHAHRLLINYCEFHENHPEYFRDVYFDRLTAIGDANLMGTQPFCDQTGRRILFYKLGLWDPDKITVPELLKATLLTLELGLLEPRSQILGGICIFDLGGIKMNHARHLTPKIAAHLIDIMVWTYPITTHAIHIVNQSSVFKAGYSVVKPFLNKEIKKRLFFHGKNMESLHQHVDPKYLPKKYGGIHPDYSYGGWIDFIRSNDKVLKELKDLGYSLEEQMSAKENQTA